MEAGNIAIFTKKALMEIEMKNTFVSKWAVALYMITFLVLRLNYI